MNLQQLKIGNDAANANTINDNIITNITAKTNASVIAKANANVNATTNTNEGN